MRNIFALILVMSLCSCRAINDTLGFGTPPEIQIIPALLDTEYDKRASYMLRDIEASPTNSPEELALKNDILMKLRGNIGAFHTSTQALRLYLKVE
jgi:hypothetical protein